MKIFCGGRWTRYPYQVEIVASTGTRMATAKTIVVIDFGERVGLSREGGVELFKVVHLGCDTEVFSNGFAAHFPNHSIDHVVMEVDGLKNYGEEWQRRRRQRGN